MESGSVYLVPARAHGEPRRMSEMAERGATSSQRDLAKSNRKRTADSAPTISSKKRNITVTTFNKWKSQFERDYSTLSWLRCDVSKEDKTAVETLWCEACRKHEDRITGMKNFSKAWINGSCNQKTSNIVDHASVSNTVRLCYECVLTLRRPQTNHSLPTLLLPAVFW